MRRIFAILFVLSAVLSWAQYRLTEDFIQEGFATQGIQTSGMNIAHPSLPIGSRPVVRNNSTHQEVEVIVIGRIPASTERIIDVSADVAQAIRLQPGQTVTVFFRSPALAAVEPPPPVVTPAPVTPPPPPPPPPPAPVATIQPEPAPPPPVVQPEPAPPPPVVQPEPAPPPPPVVQPEPAPPPPAEPARPAEVPPLNVTVNAYIVSPEPTQPAPSQQPPPAQPEPQQPTAQQPVPQPAVPQSGVPNPELNWLAWLSYMAAESRLRDITALPYSQQQQQAPVQTAPAPQIIYILPSGELYNPQSQPQVYQEQPQPQPVQPQVVQPQPVQPQYQQQPEPQPVQPQPVQPQPAPQTQFVPQEQPVQPQPVQPQAVQPQPAQPQVSAQYSAPPSQQPADVWSHQPQVIYIVPSPAIQERAAQPQTQPETQAFTPPAQAQPAPQQPAQPQPTIRVLPGIPDPNTNRVYTLMVGSYPTEAQALQITQQLRGIGFEAVHELQGGLFRAFVIGVPAASVNFAVQRLLVMGYTEIWILE